MRHDSPCCHFAPRSAAPGRGHLRTKMVPQGNVASLRRYATFAQIRWVVVETASIEMAPKRLSLVNLRLGSGVSASASPSSRLIRAEDPGLTLQAQGAPGNGSEHPMSDRCSGGSSTSNSGRDTSWGNSPSCSAACRDKCSDREP